MSIEYIKDAVLNILYALYVCCCCVYPNNGGSFCINLNRHKNYLWQHCRYYEIYRDNNARQKQLWNTEHISMCIILYWLQYTLSFGSNSIYTICIYIEPL